MSIVLFSSPCSKNKNRLFGSKQVLSLEIDDVIDGINHELRRKIILLLAERGPMKYSSLLAELDIQSGVLNYHLSKMERLLNKEKEGVYSLSSNGILAYRLLKFLQEEIKKPQRLKKAPLSPLAFLSEAGRSFLDLSVNPRRAFSHKGKGATLVSFCIGSLLFLMSAFWAKRALIEVFFVFIGTVILAAGLSVGIYGVKVSLTSFTLSFLRAQFPELILLLMRVLLSLNLIAIGELEYSLVLIIIRYIIQPALALWMFILFLFATKESADLDLSKSFVVVILTVLILRMLARLLALSQETHVLTF